jgi:hypothetical protein
MPSQESEASGAVAHTPREPLRPMAIAPKDRTSVLLRFKTAIVDRPDITELYAGRWIVARNGADSMLWSLAGPFGCGGFPDEWFDGWLPTPDDQDTPHPQYVRRLERSEAGWRDSAERLLQERDAALSELRVRAQHQARDVWFWQGDGSDHPESMSSSMVVVIKAPDLRRMALPTHPADQLGAFGRWYLLEYGHAADHRDPTVAALFKAWCASRGASALESASS